MLLYQWITITHIGILYFVKADKFIDVIKKYSSAAIFIHCFVAGILF